MQNQGTPGSVVFIASITAHVNLPGYRMAGYNVSKGGVKMLSKVLSAELAPKGIRVNSISPAFIETNQTRGAREHTTKACGDLMQTAPPLGRIGQPDEVSPAAIFFLSDAAAYVTGADILVSGGIHTGRGEFNGVLLQVFDANVCLQVAIMICVKTRIDYPYDLTVTEAQPHHF